MQKKVGNTVRHFNLKLREKLGIDWSFVFVLVLFFNLNDGQSQGNESDFFGKRIQERKENPGISPEDLQASAFGQRRQSDK